MMLKLIGACMIVAACGGVGFSMAWNYKKEEASLRQLIKALDFLYCELECRLTTLPQACYRTSGVCTGCVKELFRELAKELESQVAPDAQCCVRAALARVANTPLRTQSAFFRLGDTIGMFHLEGQLRGLQSVQQECEKELEELEANRSHRLRSYQTLGLCAGAALAILLV